MRAACSTGVGRVQPAFRVAGASAEGGLHPPYLAMTAVSLLVLSLGACHRPAPPSPGVALGATASGEPLVRVADRIATQEDVDYTLNKMLGPQAMALADAQASDKALESLVSLHAMAARQESGMGAEELRELDRRVFHYREELLMQAYVRAHTTDLAVTDDEISKFYAEHPKLFGGGELRRFETLASKTAADAEATQALQAAGGDADWEALAKRSHGKLVHARASTEGPALNPRIAAAVGSLSPGKASDVLTVDQVLLRVKLVEVVPRPPRPLPEVRDDVRRMIAARKTRDRIRELSDAVRKDTKIERVGPR